MDVTGPLLEDCSFIRMEWGRREGVQSGTGLDVPDEIRLVWTTGPYRIPPTTPQNQQRLAALLLCLVRYRYRKAPPPTSAWVAVTFFPRHAICSANPPLSILDRWPESILPVGQRSEAPAAYSHFVSVRGRPGRSTPVLSPVLAARLSVTSAFSLQPPCFRVMKSVPPPAF